MTSTTGQRLKRSNNIINIVLITALLFIVFNSGAKSWVLQQLVRVGIFQADIKPATDNASVLKDFSFIDEIGTMHNTEEMKGKVIVINFWASWCPPCRAEMPSLQKLYTSFKGDNRIHFLFLAEDEDVSNAKSYLEKNNFSIPFGQRSGVVSREVFSGTLPTTLVIDKDGKILMKHEGLANYNSSAFIKQLKGLL